MKKDILLISLLLVIIVVSSGCINSNYGSHQNQNSAQNNTNISQANNTNQGSTVIQNVSNKTSGVIEAEVNLVNVTLNDGSINIVPTVKTTNGKVIVIDKSKFNTIIDKLSDDTYKVSIELPEEINIDGHKIRIKNRDDISLVVNIKYGIVYTNKLDKVVDINGTVNITTDNKIYILHKGSVMFKYGNINISIKREVANIPKEFAFEFVIINGSSKQTIYMIVNYNEVNGIEKRFTTTQPDVPIIGHANVIVVGNSYTITPTANLKGFIKFSKNHPIMVSPIKTLYIRPTEQFIIPVEFNGEGVLVITSIGEILNNIQNNEQNGEQSNETTITTSAIVLNNVTIGKNVIYDKNNIRHDYYFVIFTTNTFKELFNDEDMTYNVEKVYVNGRLQEINITDSDSFIRSDFGIPIRLDSFNEYKQPLNITFVLVNGETRNIVVKINETFVDAISKIDDRVQLIINGNKLKVKFDNGIKIEKVISKGELDKNFDPYSIIDNIVINNQEISFYEANQILDTQDAVINYIQQTEPVNISKLEIGKEYYVYDIESEVILLVKIMEPPLFSIISSIGGTLEYEYKGEIYDFSLAPVSDNRVYKVYGVDSLNLLSVITYNVPVIVNYIFETKDERFIYEPDIIKYNVNIDTIVPNIETKTFVLYHYNTFSPSEKEKMDLMYSSPTVVFTTWALYGVFSVFLSTPVEFYYPTQYEEVLYGKNITISQEYNVHLTITNLDTHIVSCTEYFDELGVSNINENCTELTMVKMSFKIHPNDIGKVYVVFPYYTHNGNKYEIIRVSNATKINIDDLPFAIYRVDSEEFTMEFPKEAINYGMFGFEFNPFGKPVVPYIMYSPNGEPLYNGNIVISLDKFLTT